MIMEYLIIPKERIGVLIGKDGASKKTLETKTNCTLKIDSTGRIRIDDSKTIPELRVKIKEIIEAIGNGFSFDKAIKLLNPKYIYISIELRGLGKQKDITRQKSRVIGDKGRTRRYLETHTDVFVSVYEKSVNIIGETDKAIFAKRAIEMLVRGSDHSTVYEFIQNAVRYKNVKYWSEYEEA